MNWFQENKFLAGFLGVVVVGAGVLGFLTLSASGKYSAAKSDFESKATELQRLHGLTPFPDDANLKRIKEQSHELDARNLALQKELDGMELPLEQVTPEAFQDRLKETVASLLKKAAENNVVLPEKFYLGFEPYETAPPRAEASSNLARQLKVIAGVVGKLIDVHVVKLDSIVRPPLPEEQTGAASRDSATPPATGGVPAKKGGPALVKSVPFNVSFTAEQSKIRLFLNQLAESKSPFLVVRAVQFSNEQQKGPSRIQIEDPAAASAASADPALAGGTNAAPVAKTSAYKFILGTEKISATMRIEMMDFAEPAAQQAKAATK